jgi:hypothetical protein
MPFAQCINGVAKTENRMILIYDMEQFLNLNEELQLEQALLNKKRKEKSINSINQNEGEGCYV